ncbi:MAG TPA: enoyl-CoA hydratase [Burkholderiaceae bacterium]|nr:enoyl-CoA hydratase [Burkholderiaceae bacterium]
MAYEDIRVETRGDGPLRATLITLTRPAQLNALSDSLMDELTDALLAADAAPDIGCIVLTGDERAFAAGADIAAMADFSYARVRREQFITRNWETLKRVRKPVIAAVRGYALGGGCEVAMMCDIIIAADSARFGQPEIKLAFMPGAGGTQRLPRAIGKAKTMDLVLTGRIMDAAEAERAGLVSRVVPAERCLDEALAVAAQLCRLSQPSLLLTKECVNRSFETPLEQGLAFERLAVHSLFATEDRKEGMQAFVDKRQPAFSHL